MLENGVLTKEYIPLILTEDPVLIRKLEVHFGVTQDSAVDECIEDTCWGADTPLFLGHKGTPRQRLEALRRAFKRENITE
jgi:hypothetical protein